MSQWTSSQLAKLTCGCESHIKWRGDEVLVVSHDKLSHFWHVANGEFLGDIHPITWMTSVCPNGGVDIGAGDSSV